ncbi:hypothetical protein ACQ4PT_037302 [Festuca glaucescens]
MVKKRKAADVSHGHDEPQPRKRVRNRASPFALVKLHTSYTIDQKEAVVQMKQDSLLDIKCNFLHSRVIDRLCGLYDKHSCEFVIPGRGRIPLNEHSIYRTLGLPFGTLPVVYAVDSKIEEVLGPKLFHKLGSTPKRTKVFQILDEMKAGDEAFKQIWVMFVVSTVLSPTTGNHGQIDNVKNLQWCKFVADQIHSKLSNGKFRQLYLLALQKQTLRLCWRQICIMMTKKSYGKLELKPEFGVNYTLSGGDVGFSKWMDTCSDPTCPIEQKAQVANLMGSFASGMVGLMGSLVQGWTAMHGDAEDLLANTFGNVAEGFLSGLSASSAPAERVTRAVTSGTKGRYATRLDAANTRNVLLEDNTFLGDDTDTDTDSSFDGESSSDDDVGKYVVAPRKDKQVKFASSVGGDDALLSHTAAEVMATLRSVPLSRSVASPRKGKQVKVRRSLGVDDLVLTLTAPEVTATETQVATSSSVVIEGISVPEVSAPPDIPTADPDTDLIGDTMVPLSAYEAIVMKATSVPDSSTPADSPPAANVSDVIVDILPGKYIPQVDDVTRSSPRLAKHRVCADSSKLGAPPPVLDVDPVSPETSPARVEVLHPNDDVMVDVNEGAANDAPGLDVDKGAAANPSLGPADLRPPSPPRSESRGTGDVFARKSVVLPVSIKVAPPAVSSDPSIIDKEDQAGSHLHDVGVKGGVPNVARTYRRMKTRSTDDVITTTERVVTNVETRRRFDSEGNEFVSASTLFPPIPEPAVINVTQHAEPSKKADNLLPVQAVSNVPVQGCPDGLVAGKTPLTDVENPMWNFTSQSHVCSKGPSVDNESVHVGPSVPVKSTTSSMGRPPYAIVSAYDGTDDIPKGIPIEAPVGAIPVTYYSRILQIDPMWVTTSELADSMKPNGLLSNTVCDIGVAILQHTCPDNKVIFPFIITKYLMDHKFNASAVRRHFRKDQSYKLSHKDLLSFPILQNIGTDKDPFGHWFVLSLNFVAKSFEILNSLRGEDDEEMIKYDNRLVDAIKIMYKVNYSESRKQIDEYELMYIPVPKQGPTLNCGIFMLKFLELWNGSIVPAITADQIDAIRKVLTVSWLEHPDNKLINWRILLDNNMF